MSYYRRGYAWEQIHYIPAPTGGWNPDANQWELAANQAAQLDNFLVRPGAVIPRGAFKKVLAATMAPVGGVSYPNAIAVTSRSSGTSENWDAPTTGRTTVTRGNTAVQVLTGNESSASAFTVASADQIPGPRWVNLDGVMYGIAYDSAAAVIHNAGGTYTVKPTPLLNLSSGAAFTSPTIMTSAPHGSVDLSSYQQRLWMLAGVDTAGGGTAHSCTTLYFSNPIVAGQGGAAADWKDPVSGLSNKILLDNDTQNPGMALAVCRTGLLVFRRNSIWLLRGTTTNNYTFIHISSESGCLDPRSVVETDQGVFFVGEKGLMLCDGSKVINVSGSIMFTLQRAIAQQQYAVFNGNGGYISCAKSSRGNIVVSIGVYTATGINPIFCAMMDRQTRGMPWVRLTSELCVSTANGTVSQAASSAPSGSLSQTPYLGVVMSAGPGDSPTLNAADSSGVLMLENNFAQFSFHDDPALFDIDASGATVQYAPIMAIWQSRFAPVVGTTTLTRKFGQPKRYFLDYLFATSNNSAGGAPISYGWVASPTDGNGALIGPAGMKALTQASTSAGWINTLGARPTAAIQRQELDFVNEVSDLGFCVSWSLTALLTSNQTLRVTTPATGVVAALYGVGVEYQQTRDLR